MALPYHGCGLDHEIFCPHDAANVRSSVEVPRAIPQLVARIEALKRSTLTEDGISPSDCRFACDDAQSMIDCDIYRELGFISSSAPENTVHSFNFTMQKLHPDQSASWMDSWTDLAPLIPYRPCVATSGQRLRASDIVVLSGNFKAVGRLPPRHRNPTASYTP